ncbi:MAG: prepilin-type N-terminal cleavage/methylation domain-containing protein [Candidatus Nealsonbacteria bacterium]|nr:prepilin-type N-terminal cleavage/methylation domain-containing protein [Candidatus Nealsonbacteria bacterium]
MKKNINKNIKKNKNQGFTLVEILISVTILVMIFSIVSGLFFSALQSQRRSLSLQSLLKEVSYAMEYMSRQLRMTQKDDIGCTALDPLEYKNYATTVSSIKFRSYHEDPQCLEFFLETGSNRLKAKRTITAPSEDYLTSENIIVESFNIIVEGDEPSDETQPKVTISLKARAKGAKQESQPEIQIQTTVSQRNLDI